MLEAGIEIADELKISKQQIAIQSGAMTAFFLVKIMLYVGFGIFESDAAQSDGAVVGFDAGEFEWYGTWSRERY